MLGDLGEVTSADVVRSLNNLSMLLGKLGWCEEGLAAIGEAVHIVRDMTVRRLLARCPRPAFHRGEPERFLTAFRWLIS